MCLDPVTMAAASFVIGSAGAMADYSAQSSAVKAQNKAAEINQQNAKTSTFDRYDQINKRVIQEQAAASQELTETSIEAAKARASARVAAAEAGVSGLSVDAILGEMYAKEGRFARNTQMNFDYQSDYWRGEGDATRASGQNQINSMPKQAKPSFLPTAIKIFGSAVNSLDGYQAKTSP